MKKIELEKMIEELVEHDYSRMGIREITNNARDNIRQYYLGWDTGLIEMRYEDLFLR